MTPEYSIGVFVVVWNKGAEIDFVSPGKGTMTAAFEIPMVEIEPLREQAQDN